MDAFQRKTLALCASLALALILILALASTALAAPLDPTLGLTALRSRLDTAPTGIDGYLKTVVQESTIVTIPVNVLAVTGYETSDTSLILFEASGPLISKYGGIVEGMSGSPIYISDDGVDKLIGALSYGEEFTLSGTGLATPIESMMQLETDYSATQFEPFSKPVLTSSGVINRVIISPTPEEFSGAARQGAFVAKPLAGVYIGGLRPESPLYRALVKDFAAKHIGVVQLSAPLTGSPAVGESGFTTDLAGGASVAALATRGDMWTGSLGTVTYAASGTVLAYGHPENWDGLTSLFMTNAWIDGVWPSSISPFKLGRVGAVRGTVTEDRYAGIMGAQDVFPAETTITAHAVDAGTGKEATSTVYASSALINAGKLDSYYVGAAAGVASAKLYDQYETPGSAEVTTTVVVGDGSATYTVTITNMIDTSLDIPSAVAADVGNVIDSLSSVLEEGVEHFNVTSINVDSRISRSRKFATIVDVDFPDGLATGPNHAKVSLFAYGIAATQTLDATLTIPAGTPTQGTLMVSGMSSDFGDFGPMSLLSSSSSQSDSQGPYRQTIAEIVDELNATQPNNVISLTFKPNPVYPTSSSGKTKYFPAVESSVTAPWVVTGDMEAETVKLVARANPAAVVYGGRTRITGYIDGPEDDTTVTVFGTPAGSSTETTLAVGTASYSYYTDALSYNIGLPALPTNTRLRVHCDSSDGFLAASAFINLKVAARVTLGSSSKSVKTGRLVTLTSKVYPASAAGGNVTFEYYNSSRRSWVRIATKTLIASGSFAKATTSYRVGRGARKVRVRYLGGLTNAARTSATMSIVGK